MTFFYKKANEQKGKEKQLNKDEESKDSEEFDDPIKYLPLNFLSENDSDSILRESIPNFSFEKVANTFS